MQLRSFGILLFLILTALFYLAFQNGNYFSGNSPDIVPCQEPLTYQIATVDTQFNISTGELKKVISEVESIWEEPTDRNLLEYSEDGEVTIHLKYSEEQQRIEEERKLAQRIQRIKDQISVVENEQQRLTERYKSRAKEFEETLSEYNEEVEEYNKAIEKWNDQGGIPESKKSIIQDMQRRIAKLKATSDRKYQNAESLRKQANAKSKQLNKLIKQQNSLIVEYNQQFGGSRKFDQGKYIQRNNEKRIDIYQFGNRAKLKTVLAHEFGHALGLDHVDNPEAVMHAIMREQNIFNLSLTDEDIAAITQRCNN